MTDTPERYIEGLTLNKKHKRESHVEPFPSCAQMGGEHGLTSAGDAQMGSRQMGSK